MTILELSINDLKKITAIAINPETGKPVILTGDNAAGKSSVLDAIILALSNTGLDDPVRHGRPSGSVTLHLGAAKTEYILERKVTKKGAYLTLTDAAGVPVPKAQTFLNGLVGNYAFDPLEFTRQKPKAQVEALKTAAGLDFTEVDAERAAAYAERTVTARDGKEMAAQLAAVPEPAADTPKEEVSAVALVGELSKLEDSVRLVAEYERVATARDSKRRELAIRVSELEGMLGAAQIHHKEAEESSIAARDVYQKSQASAPSEEALEAAKLAITNVEAVNRAVRSAAKHSELSAKVTALRLRHAALTRTVDAVDERKAEAIKAAALPLDGLELTDEGVMFNGTFFSQLSTAEQIRISTLVAMSQNPELKIIMIREGALMNTENLAMMSALAADRGFQLWIEKFQEAPSSTGLHIIDGAIAFEDGEPVGEPAP